ncbi:hypothetical protein R1flu_010292 [Riccia fluitans]|uniref:Uncharacterized protein n=1 Tax=Riccia fluitans TaxID=41844 RepID=A0ABD1Z4K5_9MARC
MSPQNYGQGPGKKCSYASNVSPSRRANGIRDAADAGESNSPLVLLVAEQFMDDDGTAIQEKSTKAEMPYHINNSSLKTGLFATERTFNMPVCKTTHPMRSSPAKNVPSSLIPVVAIENKLSRGNSRSSSPGNPQTYPTPQPYSTALHATPAGSFP